MSHAVAISLCSAIELSLNEWGGNCESRMITWTRLGLSSRGWHCFMNCSAWEVDSPHVCVSGAYRCGNLEPIYRPLSPCSESAGYCIRYLQRTFDLTGMISCIFLLLCCVVSLQYHLFPPCVNCFYRKERWWSPEPRPQCRFPESRFKPDGGD